MTRTILFNLIFLLAAPFLFIGFINKTKAFWSGRKGASVIQPYHDFIRLLKKGQVISNTTSGLFIIAPSINLASVFFAGLLVPLVNHTSVLSFNGDFIVFSYILALGKFFSLIAAMDTGSSFEGMGTSREASLSIFSEPAFFLIMSSIIAITGIYSFKSLSSILYGTAEIGYLIIILSVITIFLMILIEGCRVPIDDPNTHLELTMIHEVMILDNSGPDFAFYTYASEIKMLLLASIIANFLIPNNLTLFYNITLYTVILFIVAITIGTIESSLARFRITHLFEFVFTTISIALIVVCLVLLYSNGGTGRGVY